ncbi:MAG: class II glutamine amidotransferase [Candidatus Woesearchaeota archaeon]
MCRLLTVRSNKEFEIKNHLLSFANIAKNSKEYQGHGWGYSYLLYDKTTGEKEWKTYKSIKPIWEDDLEHFGSNNDNTTLLIAHARSAFKDEGIVIENNMPFEDDRYIFIFNGELHGVRLNVNGRIGAEKIFNFIRRLRDNGKDNNDNKREMLDVLNKAVEIIKNRSKYIKAMNMIIVEKETNQIFIASNFGEQPDYFTMYDKKDENIYFVCSDHFVGEKNWEKIENNIIKVIL